MRAPAVHALGKVSHVLAADHPRLVQRIARPATRLTDQDDGFSLRQIFGIVRRHRHVESVWNVACGEFVRLANVPHRPGGGSNRFFQIAKTDDVRIRAGAEAGKHVPGHLTSKVYGRPPSNPGARMPYRSPGPHFEGFPCAAIDPQLWQIVVTSQRPATALGSFGVPSERTPRPPEKQSRLSGRRHTDFLAVGRTNCSREFACAVEPGRGLNASIFKKPILINKF